MISFLILKKGVASQIPQRLQGSQEELHFFLLSRAIQRLPIFLAEPTMGGSLGLKGFVVSVIGGFGNLPGAVIGGLFLGLIETFGAQEEDRPSGTIDDQKASLYRDDTDRFLLNEWRTKRNRVGGIARVGCLGKARRSQERDQGNRPVFSLGVKCWQHEAPANLSLQPTLAFEYTEDIEVMPKPATLG